MASALQNTGPLINGPGTNLRMLGRKAPVMSRRAASKGKGASY